MSDEDCAELLRGTEGKNFIIKNASTDGRWKDEVNKCLIKSLPGCKSHPHFFDSRPSPKSYT